MRIGFAGTPAFGVLALDAIARAGYTIPVVLSQPDRPKGRGLRLEASPVKALAMTLGIPVLQPATLKTERDRASAVAIPLDVLVVAAYGLLLPEAVLHWPRHGCINIHASRLPRWRGAAPIPRAIEAGDVAAGITIMQMDAGLDTGPMIEVVDVPIGERETSATLHDRLADAGAAAIVGVLDRLHRDGRLASTPQPAEGATYAAKVGKRDAAIDWTRRSADLDRQVRAYDPVPGAHAMHGDEPFKIWRAMPVARDAPGAPGEILRKSDDGLEVACGTASGTDIGGGALRLIEVQPAGGRRMPASAWASGRGIVPGVRLRAGAYAAG